MGLFEAYSAQIEGQVVEPCLSLVKVVALLFPEKRLASIEQLADHFRLPCPELRRAEPDLAVLADAFTQVLALLRERDVRTVAQALAFQEPLVAQVDFARYTFDRERIRSLPASPGVYVMKDTAGRVIYVGKAKDLRARVGSYFAATADRDAKTQTILDQLHDLEIEPTATEVEALMREAELIQRHQPPLNTHTEVHGREAPYAKSNDLVLVCPSAGGGVDVLFTSRGELLERQTLREDSLDAEDLANAVARHYFAASPERPGKPGVHAADETHASPILRQPAPPRERPEREIAASWIHAQRERAITVDVRLCEDPAHAAQLVVEYALDVLSGRPRSYRV
jgi:hypothetical protein